MHLPVLRTWLGNIPLNIPSSKGLPVQADGFASGKLGPSHPSMKLWDQVRDIDDQQISRLWTGSPKKALCDPTAAHPRRVQECQKHRKLPDGGCVYIFGLRRVFHHTKPVVTMMVAIRRVKVSKSLPMSTCCSSRSARHGRPQRWAAVRRIRGARPRCCPGTALARARDQVSHGGPARHAAT